MSPKEFDSIQTVNLGKEDIINPFPGLRPFTFGESHLFFGREGQSDEVLLNLAQHRFAAVIGASGSGKSSLMPLWAHPYSLRWLCYRGRFRLEHYREQAGHCTNRQSCRCYSQQRRRLS
jgi:ABC-type transport system involved in cytochrome bd biosynthesis fused ATPase/permease subunit